MISAKVKSEEPDATTTTTTTTTILTPCCVSTYCRPLPLQARHTAATMMNDKSSRSHAVFTLTLTQAYYFEATETTGEKVRKAPSVVASKRKKMGTRA